MSCEELRDEYELYTLGLAEELEAAELRAHLNRGCETCAAGVHSARGMMALIGSTVVPVAPSPRLRSRIMASIGAEQRSRRGWLWAPLWIAVSALSLVTAFYFYGRDRDNALLTAKFQQQAREQAIELARLNDALAILNQPETKQAAFGEVATTPRGRVFLNPKSGVLLVASNLPPAPAGKVYEMWLIPKAGKPVPAGLFQSGTFDTAVHLQKVPVDVAATKAVAVTIELAGGVPQPTSQPLIIAGLSD